MNTKIVDLTIVTLGQMGVTLKDIDVDRETPEFYISLNTKSLVESKEVVLSETYRILWTLCYGKVTDENRDLKIKLNYTIGGEEVS